MAVQLDHPSVESAPQVEMATVYRVRLITPSSYLMGTLHEVTRTSARVLMSDPPRPGTTALLQWSREERLCTVVQCDQTSCALAFEEPLKEPRQAKVASQSGGQTEASPAMPSVRSRTRGFSPASKDTAALIQTAPGWWCIRLSRPIGSMRLGSGHLSCGEEMFFFGSPLAHVIERAAFMDDDSRVARSKLPVRTPSATSSARLLSRLIVRGSSRS